MGIDSQTPKEATFTSDYSGTGRGFKVKIIPLVLTPNGTYLHYVMMKYFMFFLYSNSQNIFAK